jgi:hypothetical protein
MRCTRMGDNGIFASSLPLLQRRNLAFWLSCCSATIVRSLWRKLDLPLKGFLSMLASRKDDLKALSRARRLLNRWQRGGDIRWSQWKANPPKRRPSYRGKRQRKTILLSWSTRKKS